MQALSSALRVRKALRKFLLKTHPDFFDSDPSRRAVNEQGLKVINSLVDAATSSDISPSSSSSVSQLPSVIKIKMHYRGESDRPPFDFHMVVPPSAARNSKEFCSDALTRMLVAAGEAQPDLQSDWHKDAKREEWVTLAALDGEGLKREMLTESFMLDPPRRAKDGMGSTTKRQWQAKVVEARILFWRSRTSVHPRVKLFESQDTLRELEVFAREQTALFSRVYDLPVMIVPADFAPGSTDPMPPPGTLIIPTDESSGLIAARISMMVDSLRIERDAVRKSVSALLDCIDAVTQAGGLARISVSDSLMAAPARGTDRLILLLESPLLNLLNGCAVAVSEMDPPVWAIDCKQLTVVDDITLPLIRVAIGSSGAPLDTKCFLAAKYAINHAVLRAQVANETSFVSRRVSLLLHDDFFKRSLASQLNGMSQLSQFLNDLLQEKSSKTKLIMRFGSGSKKNVHLTEEGILELPWEFSVADVKHALLNQ